MEFLKLFNYILPALVTGLLLCACVTSLKSRIKEKAIRRDPIAVEAIIEKVVQGTPAPNGIVNVTLDYKFRDKNGAEITNKNVLTAIKTSALPDYQIGKSVGVIYLRTDSSKNILALRDVVYDL